MPLKRDDIKEVRQRKYLAKDFQGLRSQLLEYVRQYYPDKIRDFSESSLGGVFLDLAAYVGDNLSFYLDHQYGELNHDTVIETPNIERALNNAGVPIVGAAPSLVAVTIYIQVPAQSISNVLGPSPTCLPNVLAGCIFSADNGVDFILLENIDFNKRKSDGTYAAQVKVGQKTPLGVPTTYILAMSGLCVSGKETTESTSVGIDFVPFRKITLSNANVSEVVNVVDGLGNTYYEVSSLTNDVVYRNVLNTSSDSELVKDTIKVVPAPYRFTKSVDLATRKTVLTFGGGDASTLEDDVIPDPSDFAIAFPYTRTFSRISVNPEQLLQTKTLGVAATNTTIQVTYRYGGGLNHTVPKDTIKTVKTLKMFFPNSPTPTQAAQVRSSIEVSNPLDASGGDDAPTTNELKALIPSTKNSQERVVTRPDLIARVYTLPSNFGRVFRAAVRSNPNNPLATQLFIVSRNQNNNLITSPDTLKKNLRTYLNPYRMISDAIDVLDARVINLTVSFSVVIDPMLNRSIVLQSILAKLQKTFKVENFHIDQPLITSEVSNMIYATPGVISVNDVVFKNITGTNGTRTYSQETFDAQANTIRGILLPPPGGIFEVRYPEHDIIGTAAI